MLCMSDGALTPDSLLADWIDQEVFGNGYVRHSEVLGTASYDAPGDFYQYPALLATFTSTGPQAVIANSVVVSLDNEDYPYAVASEVPSLTLAPGQERSYNISIRLGT